ncbi:MAG: hypothetical protein Q8Q14_09370 [Gemmatimonadales bacterium]|nr:hypothetical protein [Gemmatimonadales bacterium]
MCNASLRPGDRIGDHLRALPFVTAGAETVTLNDPPRDTIIFHLGPPEGPPMPPIKIHDFQGLYGKSGPYATLEEVRDLVNAQSDEFTVAAVARAIAEVEKERDAAVALLGELRDNLDVVRLEAAPTKAANHTLRMEREAVRAAAEAQPMEGTRAAVERAIRRAAQGYAKENLVCHCDACDLVETIKAERDKLAEAVGVRDDETVESACARLRVERYEHAKRARDLKTAQDDQRHWMKAFTDLSEAHKRDQGVIKYLRAVCARHGPEPEGALSVTPTKEALAKIGRSWADIVRRDGIVQPEEPEDALAVARRNSIESTIAGGKALGHIGPAIERGFEARYPTYSRSRGLVYRLRHAPRMTLKAAALGVGATLVALGGAAALLW